MVVKANIIKQLDRFKRGTALPPVFKEYYKEYWDSLIVSRFKNLFIMYTDGKMPSEMKATGPKYIASGCIEKLTQELVEAGNTGTIGPLTKNLGVDNLDKLGLLAAGYPYYQILEYWDKIKPDLIACSKDKYEELAQVDLPKDFPLSIIDLPLVMVFVVEDAKIITCVRTTIESSYGNGTVYRINSYGSNYEDNVYFDLKVMNENAGTLGSLIDEYLSKGMMFGAEHRKDVTMVLNAALLVHSASNVSFEKEEFNETRAALVARKADKNKIAKQVSYRFINLDKPIIQNTKIAKSDSSGSGPSKSEHVRRGHWHTYKCGKGRVDTKLLWVNPVVVNPGANPVEKITII